MERYETRLQRVANLRGPEYALSRSRLTWDLMKRKVRARWTQASVLTVSW